MTVFIAIVFAALAALTSPATAAVVVHTCEAERDGANPPAGIQCFPVQDQQLCWLRYHDGYPDNTTGKLICLRNNNTVLRKYTKFSALGGTNCAAGKRPALIVALHGGAKIVAEDEGSAASPGEDLAGIKSTPEKMKEFAGLDADGEGRRCRVVIYLGGTTVVHPLDPGNQAIYITGGSWNANAKMNDRWGPRGPDNVISGAAERIGINDVDFISKVVLHEVGILCSPEILNCSANPAKFPKIFLVGMSKGGMLAYHAACKLGAAVFDGIAVVEATLTDKDCNPAASGKPALFHIHNELDPIVCWNTGAGPDCGYRPDGKTGYDAWSGPKAATIFKPTVQGACGDHCWPDSTKGAGWVNATELIWSWINTLR